MLATVASINSSFSRRSVMMPVKQSISQSIDEKRRKIETKKVWFLHHHYCTHEGHGCWDFLSPKFSISVLALRIISLIYFCFFFSRHNVHVGCIPYVLSHLENKHRLIINHKLTEASEISDRNTLDYYNYCQQWIFPE